MSEVLASRPIYGPLTLLQCCPPSNGSAAILLASDRYLQMHYPIGSSLRDRAVPVVDCLMQTDPPGYLSHAIDRSGFAMTQAAARALYLSNRLQPEDIQVIELHDCFSSNELITYEGLGLAPIGGGHGLVERDYHSISGQHRWWINPSGGLLSKGHPLGATGLAQLCELVWQCRGVCGPRQVPHVQYALAHNLGLGGAVVLTLLRASDAFHRNQSKVGPEREKSMDETAILCRPVTEAEFLSVRVGPSQLAKL